MIRTFTEAVNYLENFIPSPQKKHPGTLGLERMKYLVSLLGNPQFAYPTIHVGGTSGKGSTATIIASILAQKYKVGLHTSPHLVKINERIAIYGLNHSRSNKVFLGDAKQPITKYAGNTPFPLNESLPPKSSEQANLNLGQTFKAPRKTYSSPEYINNKDFIDLINDIRPFIENMEKGRPGAPSYFEIITAMAFLFFYRQKVDIAVIEVGMGGRYDATNVIDPIVAVLTNVGLDHTEVLGDTVEKIAEDKVGIIKPGIQVVSGVRQPSVIGILNAKCRMQNAKLSLLYTDSSTLPAGRQASEESPDGHRGHLGGVLGAFSYRIRSITGKGSVFNYFGEKNIKNLKLNLLGEFQVENAALAIRVIEELNNPINTNPTNTPVNLTMKQWSNETINKEEMREGLISAYIPGRIEIISKKPLIILDGAHNPDKMKALVVAIRDIFPGKKIAAIVAIKKDKKAEEMLELLLPICKKIIFTKYEIKADQGIIKSYDPRELFSIVETLEKQQRYISRHTAVVRREIVISPVKAVEEAIDGAKTEDLILVTGSLYLVGEIKRIFNF